MSHFACFGLRGRTIVAALFLSALGLRLALLSLPLSHFNPDSYEYLALGNNLASSWNYSMDGVNPDITRLPGYPFLLGLTGIFSGSVNIPLTLVLQCLLDSATALLVLLLAAEFAAPCFALGAAAVYALHPIFAVYPRLLLSETLFFFCWALFLLVLLKSLKLGSLKLAAAAGLLLAVGVLVRAAHVMYPVALIPVILVWSSGWKRAALHWTVLFLTFTLALAPWKARNRVMFGEFILGTGAGSSMLIGSIDAIPPLSFFQALRPKGDYKSIEADELYMKVAKENWRKNWPHLLAQMPHRLAHLWLTSNSGAYEITSPNHEYLSRGAWDKLFFKFSLLGLQLLILGGAAAATWILRRHTKELLFLLMPAAYVSAHILNDWGPGRYHLSALPCLLILCFWGLAEAKGRKNERT